MSDTVYDEVNKNTQSTLTSYHSNQQWEKHKEEYLFFTILYQFLLIAYNTHNNKLVGLSIFLVVEFI